MSELDRATVTPSAVPGRRAEPKLASRSFAVGEQVANRYCIERFLAQGGMGEVYEAHDLELATPVALKTILPEIAVNPAALHRFRREVLLARRITHPNICRVFDFGQHTSGGQTVSFLTMELLRGESLADRLARGGPVPSAEILPLVDQLARALDAAHGAGVVHRDFKSANVLLVPADDPVPRVVVTDFGTAREHGTVGREPGARITSEYAIVGTPAYMAPEQVLGDVAGPAADIYALGVVLFELVTGALPFHGDTPIATAVQRLHVDPPRPSSLIPDLDPRWEEAILRCLDRDPSRRFRSGADVMRALAGEPEQSVAGAGGQGSSVVRHQLPAERDGFVGRRGDLDQLSQQLASGSKLVSVVGPGGAGKTRLVTRYAWTRLREWPGGAWFCDLAEARTVDGIVLAVARSLEVPLGKGDPVAQLGHAIAARGRCLVILDNFEQVARCASETLGRWLERTAEAQFVVTSRELLGLAGERTQPLAPLDDPAAVELFTTRARAAKPGFRLAADELRAVEELVRALEGIPLAIELAAARVRLLPPKQILARMKDRFRLLANGAHRDGRHATLRATLDWSWDLLAEWEKAALAQASVFEGGFTVESAEGVLELSPWPEAPWAMDAVQSLVDKSLVRPADDYRFDLLVSVKEYAAEKLRSPSTFAGSGPGAEQAAQLRHGRRYSESGSDEAIDALDTHGGVDRRRTLARDFDNLVAACRRAIARGDGEVAVATCRGAWAVLELQGPFGAGAELAEAVVALTTLDTESRARIERVAGDAWRFAGRPERAHSCYEAALRGSRELGDRSGEGSVLDRLGNLDREGGSMDEARASYEAALAIARAIEDSRREGIVLGDLGILHADQGRMDEARVHYTSALVSHRESGDRVREGGVLLSLGILDSEQGRFEEARVHYDAALAIQRELGNRRAEGQVLCNAGNLCLNQGRMDEARGCYETALALLREVGARPIEAIVLGNIGLVLHSEPGRTDEARAHYEAALAIHREMGSKHNQGLMLGNLAVLHLEQGRFAEARTHCEPALAIHRELRDGRTTAILLSVLGAIEGRLGDFENARARLTEGEALLREIGDRLELGKLLCCRAEVDHRAGDTAAAVTALGEAEGLARALGAGPGSELAQQLDDARSVLASRAS